METRALARICVSGLSTKCARLAWIYAQLRPQPLPQAQPLLRRAVLHLFPPMQISI